MGHAGLGEGGDNLLRLVGLGGVAGIGQLTNNPQAAAVVTGSVHSGAQVWVLPVGWSGQHDGGKVLGMAVEGWPHVLMVVGVCSHTAGLHEGAGIEHLHPAAVGQPRKGDVVAGLTFHLLQQLDGCLMEEEGIVGSGPENQVRRLKAPVMGCHGAEALQHIILGTGKNVPAAILGHGRELQVGVLVHRQNMMVRRNLLHGGQGPGHQRATRQGEQGLPGQA